MICLLKRVCFVYYSNSLSEQLPARRKRCPILPTQEGALRPGACPGCRRVHCDLEPGSRGVFTGSLVSSPPSSLQEALSLDPQKPWTAVTKAVTSGPVIYGCLSKVHSARRRHTWLAGTTIVS